MLLSFSVSNFRSIRKTQTLSMVGTHLKGPHEPFDVQVPGGGVGVVPNAIIYGANASGKSNLLDAIVRMRFLVQKSHSDAQKNKKIRFNPFLLDAEAKKSPSRFEISFLHNRIRYDYGFEHDDQEIIEEWLASYPEGRRRKLFDRKRMKIEFGPGMRGAKKVLLSFLKDQTLFSSIAALQDGSEINPVSQFFDRIFAYNKISVASLDINHDIKDGGIDRRAIDFLNSIGTGICSYKIEESLMPEDQYIAAGQMLRAISNIGNLDISDDDINFDRNRQEVKLGHVDSVGEFVYFDIEAESEGTRRLLQLMSKVFQTLDDGGIALIDEIDASLHTHAVEEIIGLFLNPEYNKLGAQLVATTHDTNLMNTDLLRRDEIWFSDKNSDGESEYYSLSEIKTRKVDIFEKSYLQGRYGAIPLRRSIKTYSKNYEDQ